MDTHTFRILEFDKVLQMASAFAATAPGKAVIGKIRPLYRAEEIRQRIVLVAECRTLLSSGRVIGIENVGDNSPLFQKIRPAHAVLDPVELRSLLPLLYSASNLRKLRNDELCPEVGVIAAKLTTHIHIIQSIENSIDRECKVRDEASEKLLHVRKSIRHYEKKIKTALEGILQRKDLLPHLQDFYLAERNHRWVIPVKIDSKGSVPGIIHDISNTGETVYVEPYSIQGLGNDLESYRAEEKVEEYRILRSLSSLIREHLGEIEEDYSIVAEIDALCAVARFSDQMQMMPPEINNDRYVKIIKGRHPLLWRTLKHNNRERGIVPLDMEIGRDSSCMVITGSNAGGKTVALKTIGVLTLMALSGMHAPADSGSTFPVLNNIFADIGDEQSIEQSLSTFSAHITRISEILHQSSSPAMIIIDELGTGTDPEQGGALSCAILRTMKHRGLLSVVSTHLGMLKAFAHAEAGMINSAMEMAEVVEDGITRYTPTYKLIMGEPGTSHTLEIAESLGLQEDIIREARNFLTREEATIEVLISELQQKTKAADMRLKEIDDRMREIDGIRSELEGERSTMELVKKNTLSEALGEAEEIVRKAKRETEEIVRRMKKSPPSEKGKLLRDLGRIQSEIQDVKKSMAPEAMVPLDDIDEGSRVFIKTLKTHGMVSSVNKKAGKCTIVVDGKEIMVPLSRVCAPLTAPEGRDVPDAQGKERGKPSLHPSFVSLDAVHPSELNVVGQRVDPALSLTERFLNDAALSGVKQVRIIHGIGTGTLSRAIRDYLKDHPLVTALRKGNEDEGGEAVTIAEL